MATLTNTKIKDTYPGLIKLDDNGAVQPTALKQLTDGTGGSLPIQISQIETKFSGAVDLTGVTVTGLDPGGLVAGTGEDSLVSAAALTTLPAISLAPRGIAIGNNARVNSTFAQDGIAIGNNAESKQASAVSIGEDSIADANGVSVGVGAKSSSSVGQHVAIGGSASAGWGAVSIATNSDANSKYSVALGYNSQANTAEGSVALGANVTAETAYTVTVNLLQIAGYATMNYVDDAAAATGGIPLGGVYHTDGALKIRIV
jgi:hypothetical protein